MKPILHRTSRAALVGPNSMSVRPFLIIIAALNFNLPNTCPEARSFLEAVMIRKDIIELFRVPAGETVRLKDYNPGWAQSEEMEELGKDALKERARQILDQNLADLAQAQELLYADDRYSVLIVLQAMDAAGKDGTIKHVMSGVNPQGCQVFSFKKPSAEELHHNFLWRYMRCLPERGRIGIFNRSYYEDVLVVKVHPELLVAQRLPAGRPGRSSGDGATRTSTRSSGTWSGTGR